MGPTNQIIAELWRDVEQRSMQTAYDRAKADPFKNRLTKVMEKGKPASYRYGGWIMGRGSRRVAYCWSCHRNAAGFFLGWREIETADRVIRDQWTARRVKQQLRELQLKRFYRAKAAPD